jgi:hypothetical protein
VYWTAGCDELELLEKLLDEGGVELEFDALEELLVEVAILELEKLELDELELLEKLLGDSGGELDELEL